MMRGRQLTFALGACTIALLAAWSIVRERGIDGAVRASAPAPISTSPAVVGIESTSERRAVGVESMGRIRGTVTDSAGAIVPALGAPLTFEDESGRRLVTGWDASGAFDARGLALGRWKVSCAARGYSTEIATVELEARRKDARLDFVLLRERPVRLKLVDRDGAPLADAFAAAGLAAVLVPSVVVVEDDVVAPPLPGTRYARLHGDVIPVLEAARTRWILRSGERELASIVVRADADEVVHTVDVAELRALSARVRLTLGASDAVGAHVRVTIGDGRAVELEIAPGVREGGVDLPPGAAAIVLAAPDRALYTRELQLAPGETLDLGTLAFEPGSSIVGSIRDDAGRPMGAPLTLEQRGPDGAWTRRPTIAHLSADANGRFSTSNLASGTWRIACAWGGRPTEFETPARVPLAVVGTWPDVNAPAGSRPATR